MSIRLIIVQYQARSGTQRHKDVLLCMRHQCSEKGYSRYYRVTSSVMERSQACSLGSDDSLSLLIARRDRLTEHIERSYDYLCEDLESLGIGRGKCYREPRRRAPPVSQVMSAQVPVRSPGNLKSVQARAQRMMGKGRGAV